MRSVDLKSSLLVVAACLGVAAGVVNPVSAQSNSWGGDGQAAVYGVPGQVFSFGAWGDMPYIRNGDLPKMDALVSSMNESGVLFSVFLGDIKDGASLCTEDHYTNAIARFNSLVAPAVYIPGDNEWTDCHRTNNGGYNGLERLEYIRQTMFNTRESFGTRRMALEHQGPLSGKFAENVRWVYGDVTFLGLNIPGSNNNKVNTPEECTNASARTQADCEASTAEYLDRDAANIAWLRDTFRLAKEQGSVGIVVVIQADPCFDRPETSANERTNATCDGYNNFIDAITGETQLFDGQVLLIHGDTHYFTIDKPLVNVNNPIRNFTRLETFGSPNVHWVRIEVNPRGENVFSIVPVYVPGN